jgi:hypothetical protein
MNDPTREEPRLLSAASLAEADVGTFEWDRDHVSSLLAVSPDGRTIEWRPRKVRVWQKFVSLTRKDSYPPAWVPASTRMHVHSGTFRLDFVVDEMARAQIGIGFMLLWNAGPDWGFFGYLGSSPTAWAYDPSTGDVVCNTNSIQGGLPKFWDGRTGLVSVRLELPRHAEGFGSFIVDGLETRRIPLPAGAVVLPAACLLRESQRVTLRGYERR